MKSNPVQLAISPDKVAYVIIKAREFDAKVDAWNEPGDVEENDASNAILENYANDPVRREASAFISALNVDEQVELVAIAWLGRGTFEIDEFDEAVKIAREERVNSTADYLLGMPLLADFLADGLDKLGYSVEEAEDDIVEGEVIWPRGRRWRVFRDTGRLE